MTNTKLCSECRHSNNDGKRFLLCTSIHVIFAYKSIGIDKGFYASLARRYDRLCGTEAKHFEPIGGTDGQD